MRNNILDKVVYKSTSIVEAVFTADPVTDLLTSNAHGFLGGEKLQFTTATTLPAGLSLLTNYYVINPTTNTFQVSVAPNGPAVNITDAGTGQHKLHVKGNVIWVGDYKYILLSIGFSNTPTMTVKVQGALSEADNCPDFTASATVLNRWDYLMLFALQQETGVGGESGIAGNTGVSCSGAAAEALYRINTDGLSWISADVTAFTQGNIDVRISAYQ